MTKMSRIFITSSRARLFRAIISFFRGDLVRVRDYKKKMRDDDLFDDAMLKGRFVTAYAK